MLRLADGVSVANEASAFGRDFIGDASFGKGAMSPTFFSSKSNTWALDAAAFLSHKRYIALEEWSWGATLDS